MTAENKARIVDFGKKGGFALGCFIALITESGLINAAVSGQPAFYAVVGGINLVIEGVFFYVLGKKIFANK